GMVAPQFLRAADVRYLGQSFELTVPVPATLANVAGASDLLDAFHHHYEAVYGYADSSAEAEVINIRVQVIGQTTKPRIAGATARRPGDLAAKPTEPPTPARRRTVSLAASPWDVPTFDRAHLQPHMTIPGPCIIEQYDTTTFVTPGFIVEVDSHANLI